MKRGTARSGFPGQTGNGQPATSAIQTNSQDTSTTKAKRSIILSEYKATIGAPSLVGLTPHDDGGYITARLRTSG